MKNTKVNVKHTRPVNDDDKFFVVEVLLNNKDEGQIGWIEKQFIKNDFLRNLPIRKGTKVKILNVIEFKDRAKYESYKSRN